MISIEEAILAVKKNSSKISKAINIPIVKAGNSTLFSDVYSPIDMPPFRQSAMDGYALNLHDNFTYSFNICVFSILVFLILIILSPHLKHIILSHFKISFLKSGLKIG